VDTQESSVWREATDPHPHACYDGWIYLTHSVFDEAVGEEVEKIEVIPCLRCRASTGLSQQYN
jgi:hypothetical protein